jgi:hypothetical protein
MPDTTPKSRPFYLINQDYRNDSLTSCTRLRCGHEKVRCGRWRALVDLFQLNDIASYYHRTLELAPRLPERPPRPQNLSNSLLYRSIDGIDSYSGILRGAELERPAKTGLTLSRHLVLRLRLEITCIMALVQLT